MKIIIKSLLTLIVLLSLNPAQAEVKLESASELLGTWRVTAEAVKYEGEKKALDVIWEFREGGVLNTISKDPRTSTITVPLTYSVEDGMIKKQSVPGRQKFETCAVLKKSGPNMEIKCAYLFFFLTKQ